MDVNGTVLVYPPLWTPSYYYASPDKLRLYSQTIWQLHYFCGCVRLFLQCLHKCKVKAVACGRAIISLALILHMCNWDQMIHHLANNFGSHYIVSNSAFEIPSRLKNVATKSCYPSGNCERCKISIHCARAFQKVGSTPSSV